MAKYRKKPVEIEAIQFKRDCFEEIKEFTNGKAFNFRTERCFNGKSYCDIETLEGVHIATEGDYIIKGVKGEFYPCKPDVFEMTYEAGGIGEISDGYHTFNELYYHRMILFSVICNMNRSKAWKSWKHHDGSMYNDYFIVGIDTPEGQYSYHYHKEHWDRFNVEELENAPEWDGHEPKDINRLISLIQEVNKECGSENNEKLNLISIKCDGEGIVISTELTLEEVAEEICYYKETGSSFVTARDCFEETTVFFNPQKVTLIKYWD